MVSLERYSTLGHEAVIAIFRARCSPLSAARCTTVLPLSRCELSLSERNNETTMNTCIFVSAAIAQEVSVMSEIPTCLFFSTHRISTRVWRPRVNYRHGASVRFTFVARSKIAQVAQSEIKCTTSATRRGGGGDRACVDQCRLQNRSTVAGNRHGAISRRNLVSLSRSRHLDDRDRDIARFERAFHFILGAVPILAIE